MVITLPPTPPETLLHCQVCKQTYSGLKELAPRPLVCKNSFSSENEVNGDPDAHYTPPDEDEKKLARKQEKREDTSEVETEEE